MNRDRNPGSFCQSSGLYFLLLLMLAGPAAAATITIDPTTAGGIAGAIAAAGAGDTIILNQGTYTENGITVNKNLIIRANTSYGHGYSDTTIDGSNAARIMTVNAGVTLTLDNLTLTRGAAGAGNGGAIRNSGTLTVTTVHFTSCSATNGGAIENLATATITASEFSSCSATGSGGAILSSNLGASALTITSTTFTSCSAPYGGAIVNGDTMSVQTSVFSGCSATGTSGGAIYNQGTITSIKSTAFSGCSAGTWGGAIYNPNGKTITSLQFSRFHGNTATSGGKAIYNGITGTITDATDNWWGTNANPSGFMTNPLTFPFTPYLLLNASAFPPSITSIQTTVVQANLTYDSTGAGTIGSGHIPNGTTVTFTIVSGPGSVSPASNTTTNGAAETTFTPAGAGTTNISATVDGQTVYTNVITAWGAPGVTGVTPASGSTGGGTVVTITGSGFSGATAVNFGAAASAGFTVNSNTQITATSPAGAAGTVDITVITPGGTSATGPADRFTYTVAQASSSGSSGGNPGSNSGDSDDPVPSMTPTTTEVNVGGNSAVRHVAVTGTGLSGLVVTGQTQAGTGPNVPPPPGIVYQYIDLVPARFNSITGATITFTVPVSWLEEHHLTSREIVMYHYTSGKWTALPTMTGATTNGMVTFTATSPSFSFFAITGQPGTLVTGEPDVKTSDSLTEESSPVPTPQVKIPVITQTTTVPPPAGNTEPASPLPILAIAGLIILTAGGFLARRWWIRRQNPALFEDP